MTEKSSKKTSSQEQEITTVEDQKPSSAHKKQGSEIDEIFAGKKRNKSKAEETENSDDVTKKQKKSEAEKTEKSEDVTKKPKKSKKNMKKSKGSAGVGDIADPPRPRKTTEDGLAIYSEEELGINRADAGSLDFRLGLSFSSNRLFKVSI